MLTLRPSGVLAEEAPKPLMPSTSLTKGLVLVPGPTKDFTVRAPASWITSTDNYPGRLVFSSERPTTDGSFVFLQVARLNLQALFRSAGAALPGANKASSKWEELAVGDRTAAVLATWMLNAQQKSIQAQTGKTFVRNVDIVDAQLKSGGTASSGSELSWHARVTVPPGGLTGGGALEGSSGKMYSLNDQPDAAGNNIAPRTVSGKALLRGGIVVFAVVDGPKTSFDADFNGTPMAQYFDEIVGSLELTAPQ